MARYCSGLFVWQYSGLVDALFWSSINPTYTAINVVEAVVGALLLRKLLPWYNPLQNLNDWIRTAIGSALIPAGGRCAGAFTDTQPGAAA